MRRAPTSPPHSLVRGAVGQASRPVHPERHPTIQYRYVTKYIRYQFASTISYGTLGGDTVHQLQGGLFDAHIATGATHQLAEVKLLYPCEPGKILAVGRSEERRVGKECRSR